MVGGKLAVQPDVLYRQAQFLKQVEDELQLAVGQRLARHTAVEHRHAHEGFAVEDRDGHLRAEQLELFSDSRVALGFEAFTAQDASPAEESAADAGIEG